MAVEALTGLYATEQYTTLIKANKKEKASNSEHCQRTVPAFFLKLPGTRAKQFSHRK